MLYVDIEKKLDSFTLCVKLSVDNHISALFGASGAGKSMTLKCIAGLEKPDKGIIKLNDRVLFDSERHIDVKPQDRRVGYLFQDYALFPDMTVEQNICAGSHHLPRRERSQAAMELMDRFRLSELAHKRPSALSGGEKQRVALARIFASSPDVLLLDEPFSSLDTLLKAQLLPYIKDICQSFSGAAILVSHDIGEVLQLCDTVTVIRHGTTEEPMHTAAFYEEQREQYEVLGRMLYRPKNPNHE